MGQEYEFVQLNQICKIIAGQSPSSDTYNTEGIGIPFFQGKADFGIKSPTIRMYCSKPIKIAEPGDILISVRAPVGPTNLCNIKSCIGRGLSAIRPSIRVDYKYLIHFLKYYEPTLEQSGVGSTFKAITQADLCKIEIPLPPLEEQKRIAAILDSADSIRTKRKAAIAKLDELAQSIFLDMFGDPVKNEKGWNVCKLKTITRKIGSGSTPTGGDASYIRQGISLIRSMNVYDSFFEYDSLAHIDKQQAKKLDGVTVERNDVLLNITGASVCRCTRVPEDILPARVNQHVSIIRPDSQIIDSQFIQSLLVSPSYKELLLQKAQKNGATREALTKEQIEDFDIVCPPRKLQDIFCDKANTLQNLKKKFTRSLSLEDTLFSSLQQRAFSGEL